MAAALELFGHATRPGATGLPGSGGRLRYTEHAPPPDVAHAVACIWSSAVLGDGTANPVVVPDGCAEIVVSRVHEPLVFGPATVATRLDLPPAATFFGVRLRPGWTTGIVPCPASSLTDCVVPLAALVPDSVAGISTPAALLAQLRRWISDGTPAGPHPTVALAADLLSRDPALTIGAVAGRVDSPLRTLSRRFQAQTGLRPVEYRRIARFRRASAGTRGGLPLSRVAAETGYADQAHLTREFQRLAGCSPRALLLD